MENYGGAFAERSLQEGGAIASASCRSAFMSFQKSDLGAQYSTNAKNRARVFTIALTQQGPAGLDIPCCRLVGSGLAARPPVRAGRERLSDYEDGVNLPGRPGREALAVIDVNPHPIARAGAP
jgi:hypothetical protein